MWHEAAAATLPAGSVVQYWGVGQDEAVELARRAVGQGARLVLSPGDHAYLDQKYDAATTLGLEWAGHVSVSAAYDWDPATLIDGVSEDSILGVESALWSETTADSAAIDSSPSPVCQASPRSHGRRRRHRGGMATADASPTTGHGGTSSASTTSVLPRWHGQRDRLVQRTETGADEIALRGVGGDGRAHGEIADRARPRTSADGRPGRAARRDGDAPAASTCPRALPRRRGSSRWRCRADFRRLRRGRAGIRHDRRRPPPRRRRRSPAAVGLDRPRTPPR